ncbi:hypothetical protein O6H91_Y263900 [Diphasiastrum complanatum]|nr:hypothetical protein O6H91_Y263900 [Diphasiastrum complanatum]
MEESKYFQEGEASPMKKLDDDTTLHIFQNLNDPRDIARIAIVSHSWRCIVIQGRLWRRLCVRQFPVLESFGLPNKEDEIGCSSTASYLQPFSIESLEAEHLTYCTLFKKLMGKLLDKSCILEPLSASSTDNFPDESIAQTLYPTPTRRELKSPSYWSSQGQRKADVPESLTYQLVTRLCVVHEVRIRPFQAYFQRGNPIYSARFVRFRMGYSLSSTGTRIQESDSPSTSTMSTDRSPCKDYVWTYVSPEFAMLQADTLQSFKLPQPVLCIGGILQVELLGRVQTQRMDQLYYICICHVNVVGMPLPDFDFNIINDSLVLHHLKEEPNTRSELFENDTTSTDNLCSWTCWLEVIYREVSTA